MPVAASKQDVAPAAASHPQPPEEAAAGTPSADVSQDAASASAGAEPWRLVVLTPSGPLVLGVEVYIDGESQQALIERTLDEVMALARSAAAHQTAAAPDSVAAGEPAVSADATWPALVASERFNSGALGNAPLADAAARDKAAKDFDANRDTRVQRSELAAFLAGDFARGRPFSVEWATDSGSEKWNAPLFLLLDTDADGRLAAAELAAAAVRLRTRDVDDNDVVTVAEILPPQPAPGRRNRGEPRPTRAFELRQLTLDPIFYAMVDLYDVGGGLDAQCFALAPSLLRALDKDQSGAVSYRELPGLLNARPDLVVVVRYALADRGGAPSLELAPLSAELVAAGVRTQAAPGRLTVELPRSKVELAAVYATGASQPPAATARAFSQLDSDQNERLDREEFAKAPGSPGKSFDELDANRDGQLSLEELQSLPGGRVVYRDLQVAGLAAEAPDAIFGWLDSRPDRRLTSRELAGAAGRLSELDQDADGAVAPAEVPDQISLVIRRGARDATELPRYEMPGTLPRGGPQAPPWMTAMDQNGDGEISRREFLGTAEQFARLDANGDGFVDAGEARAETSTAGSAAGEAAAPSGTAGPGP
jgi:Ca2+-binding EF-hand superfamily protein